MKTKLAILFICLASVAGAEVSWKTFRSAEGGKSFVGKLVGFDKEGGLVTVRMKSTMAAVSFKLEQLSEDDQAYVHAEAPALPANVSLGMDFTKIMDLQTTKRGDNTRTKIYNGGYRINLHNNLPETVEDVEMEYVVIYRKDVIGDRGERVLHSGSKVFKSLSANLSLEVIADGIVLENHFQGGKATYAHELDPNLRANRNAPNAIASVSKSQKRRDVLIGCIARIKVGGNVVHVEASSPDTLREYAEVFDQPER